MNKIPLTNIFIYEFQIDTNLVDNFYNQILRMDDLFTATSDSTISNPSVGVFRKQNGKHKPFYDKDLFDKLQECVDEVCDLHFIDSKLAICDSWLSKSSFASTSAPHLHACSVLSGLLYLTSHERSETSFIINDPIYDKFNPIFVNCKNPYYKFLVKPKKGKLIIWKSDIGHWANPHTDKNPRYALAFNTWFTGLISSGYTRRLIADVLDVSRQVKED